MGEQASFLAVPSFFPGGRGGSFVFVRGHLFTLAETLWTLVPHAKLCIRLRFGGPLRPEGSESARYTQQLFWLFFCLNTNHTASSMIANLQVEFLMDVFIVC